MKYADRDDTPVDPPARRRTTPTNRHTVPTTQPNFTTEDCTTAPVDIRPHEEIQAGSYEIIKKIGEGAMAEIYLARHVHLSDDHHEERVALKVFSSQNPWGKQALERIRIEVRASRNVVNRYVVRVYGPHAIPRRSLAHSDGICRRPDPGFHVP